MNRILFFFGLVFLMVHSSFAQDDLPNVELRNKVYLLDTMWTPSFTKRYVMKDSLSFLTIKGDSIEFNGVSGLEKFHSKGIIIRWKEELNTQGFKTYSFYMVKRGIGKGSLTITITEFSADFSEIHILNAWSTFDRKFIAHQGQWNEIIPVIRKKNKPGKK